MRRLKINQKSARRLPQALNRLLSHSSVEAVLKLLYLALRNIAKKWTMPIREWKAALNRFAIVYENRMPAD